MNLAYRNMNLAQELKDTIAVGSYDEPVDFYADGTWQIVNSKKTHS
jgi:hypothetical protein